MSASLSLTRCAIGCRSIFGGHKLLKLRSPLLISRNALGYWNHDWKPGPYPRTQEERDRAAKRYGLLPEDYEPFPDDGNAPGDYPNLPAFSANNRDQFEFYEHKQFTRHHGEPVHMYINFYRVGFIDPNDGGYWRWKMPYWKQLVYFLTSVSTVVIVLTIGRHYKYYPAVMGKQFPYDKKGQAHYLLEGPDE